MDDEGVANCAMGSIGTGEEGVARACAGNIGGLGGAVDNVGASDKACDGGKGVGAWDDNERAANGAADGVA